MKGRSSALLLIGVVFLAASALWFADAETGPFVPTSSTPTATPRPPGQAVPEQDGEREPSDLTHRQRILQRFACGDCHGVDRGWLMPVDHSSMTEGECLDCHQAVPEPRSIAIHATMDQATVQDPCGACHSDFAEHASPMTTEQQDCSSCHGREADEVLPGSHADRSQDISTCMVCHETQLLAAPAVPHWTDGWEQCNFCHGEQRLTPLAGAHEGDVNEQCLRCHGVVQMPPETHRKMLLLSHENEGCTSCHAEGLLVPLPDSHLSRPEVLCTLCHSATYTEPPLVPHSLTTQIACKNCHAPDTLDALPSSHANRTEQACEACHDELPGGVPTIPHDLDDRRNCTDCHVPAVQPP